MMSQDLNDSLNFSQTINNKQIITTNHNMQLTNGPSTLSANSRDLRTDSEHQLHGKYELPSVKQHSRKAADLPPIPQKPKFSLVQQPNGRYKIAREKDFNTVQTSQERLTDLMKKDRLDLAKRDEYNPKPNYKDYLQEIKMRHLKNQVRKLKKDKLEKTASFS